MTPKELRAVCATGEFQRPTSGVCPGHVQANLVVLPKAQADDFRQFCRQNPKPCPLLEVVGPGSHNTTRLADNADLLNTLPQYLVWKDGKVHEQVPDITAHYTDDLVFFLLGCSFSFEQALVAQGISLRHMDQDKNVAMYDTAIPLDRSGPFDGNMVVSMRPVHWSRVADACTITGRFPEVHGAPVHIGYPEMIGITDIDAPDYGDAVEIRPDEIPVFWACGVTPQNVLATAKPPFAITHAPGFMFVGDVLNTAFSKG
ncbi:MAG: putative hydro-lyase [Desulfobacter sp.]